MRALHRLAATSLLTLAALAVVCGGGSSDEGGDGEEAQQAWHAPGRREGLGPGRWPVARSRPRRQCAGRVSVGGSAVPVAPFAESGLQAGDRAKSGGSPVVPLDGRRYRLEVAARP